MFVTYQPSAFLLNDVIFFGMSFFQAYVSVMTSTGCFCHVQLPGRHSPVSPCQKKIQLAFDICRATLWRKCLPSSPGTNSTNRTMSNALAGAASGNDGTVKL